jgi:anti-sigma F factor antagonist
METLGKVMVVSLKTEIDAHSAERLRAVIDAAFEKSPCTHMVFDFEHVGFMDSSGIGMIMGRYKNAEKRGGKTDAFVRAFRLAKNRRAVCFSGRRWGSRFEGGRGKWKLTAFVS